MKTNNLCNMKRIITLLVAFACAVPAFAQGSVWKQVLDIVEIENENTGETVGVYNMPDGDKNFYYLDVGTLGIGTDIIQANVDPVFHLFIPLGETLEEAQQKMQEIRDFSKNAARKTTKEITGCLALGNPSTGEFEPVYMTARRVLTSKVVEFSVQRNGYVRATYLTRSTLGSLNNGIKFYRKLHKR